MKLKHAAVLISVALLAACGVGKQEGEVRFIGTVPLTSGMKDLRTVQTYCPGCGDPIAVDTARCPNKKCKVDMTWRPEYKCPSCQGSGNCPACYMMEQKGECYNCKGQGVLIFGGQSATCPNCKGTKVCPICKGTRKCDACGGEGKIGKEIVKAKAAKWVNKEDGLPDSDPRPPVEKKDEMPKEEPKKDTGTAVPEEKK